MARMRVFMVFVLAVTAGGALAFGTYNYVQNKRPGTVSIPSAPDVRLKIRIDWHSGTNSG